MTERKTILYADDYERIRRVYEKILSKSFPDFTVKTFNDGGSLETRLAGNLENVALVITDYSMPGSTGGQIIERNARREECRNIPFILLSAEDELVGKIVMEKGAFAYLKKPIETADFISTVRRALNNSEPKLLSQ